MKWRSPVLSYSRGVEQPRLKQGQIDQTAPVFQHTTPIATMPLNTCVRRRRQPLTAMNVNTQQ